MVLRWCFRNSVFTDVFSKALLNLASDLMTFFLLFSPAFSLSLYFYFSVSFFLHRLSPPFLLLSVFFTLLFCSSVLPLLSTLLFSDLCTFRRRPWPLWPLTPSLWAWPCHRAVEQEAAVTRRGQINLNQSASMSPTSRSASGTRTCVRCLGCESLIVKPLKLTRAFYSYPNSLFSHFSAIWEDPWCWDYLQWERVKGEQCRDSRTALIWFIHKSTAGQIKETVRPLNPAGVWLCDLRECDWGRPGQRKAERNHCRRQEDRGEGLQPVEATENPADSADSCVLPLGQQRHSQSGDQEATDATRNRRNLRWDLAPIHPDLRLKGEINWIQVQPSIYSPASGWKINPVMGAMYAPELYTGAASAPLLLPLSFAVLPPDTFLLLQWPVSHIL